MDFEWQDKGAFSAAACKYLCLGLGGNVEDSLDCLCQSLHCKCFPQPRSQTVVRAKAWPSSGIAHSLLSPACSALGNCALWQGWLPVEVSLDRAGLSCSAAGAQLHD